MRKILIILIVLSSMIFSCRSLNIIDVKNLNAEKWRELEKISVQTDRGYKYVKTTFIDGQYNTMITTHTTNMKITADDKRKIESVLQKYE